MPRLGSRRRAWQAAISPGEVHATVDPGIPEWDLLLGGQPRAPRQGAGTRGSETSHYPQEKKENSMAGVGATETAAAQTESRWETNGRCGVAGPGVSLPREPELRWKSGAVEGDSPVGVTAEGIPGSLSTVPRIWRGKLGDTRPQG